MEFKFSANNLAQGLDMFNSKAEAAIQIYAQTSALKLQSDAQQNAPWTDRTGHARQRLKGDALKVTNGYKLRLAHGVDYGVFLELAHAKRFAIIEKTLRYTGQLDILPGMKNLLERMNKSGK